MATEGEEGAITWVQLLELLRFTFPRQGDKDLLCLSDYFAPVESGRIDVAAFQIVTAGSHVLDLIARLNEKGKSPPITIKSTITIKKSFPAKHNQKSDQKSLGGDVIQGYSEQMPLLKKLAH